MKNGPPSSAVTTPTGISVGAMMVRAKVSQMTRKAPPRKKDPGINSRWSGPTSMRRVCGTISPTKPIGPLNAVTAPVRIDAAKYETSDLSSRWVFQRDPL